VEAVPIRFISIAETPMNMRTLAGTLVLSLASITAAHALTFRPDIPVRGGPGGNGGGNSPAAAPEIDPASAFSALTFLAGGLAVIRGRRSPRDKNDNK